VKKGIIALVILLIAGFSYWYIEFETEENVDKDKLTLYGNVDIRDVVLSFRVPGRISKMLLEEGNKVVKGQVLALLDDDTYAADMAMTEAELNEVIAREANAQRTYLRRAKLITTGAVSQALHDDALAMRDELKARVTTAKARIQKSRIALQDTKLKAPVDGIILTRIEEPGAIVNAGQAVYTLAINNPVWIRAFINEPELGIVTPGQKALIYTDSKPDKPYEGHVGFISPQAEFTPKTVETTQLRTDLVYRIRVVVDNPDRGLLQGMPVTVKLNLGENKQ
jgi:HlyD family secretion protein